MLIPHEKSNGILRSYILYISSLNRFQDTKIVTKLSLGYKKIPYCGR